MEVLKDRSGIILFCKKEDTLYVLLVKQRFSKHHGVPKGEIEGKSRESAEREVHEETGIQPTQYRILGGVNPITIFARYNGNIIKYRLKLYIGMSNTCIIPKPIDRHEIEFAKWYPLEQAIVLMFKSQPEIAKMIGYTASRISEKIFKRTLDGS